MTVTIHIGTAGEALAGMEAGSVHMALTSPPNVEGEYLKP